MKRHEMFLRRGRAVSLEAGLLLADIGTLLYMVTVCRLVGHRAPVWQQMAAGPIGVCPRCRTTIVTHPIREAHGGSR